MQNNHVDVGKLEQKADYFSNREWVYPAFPGDTHSSKRTQKVRSSFNQSQGRTADSWLIFVRRKKKNFRSIGNYWLPVFPPPFRCFNPLAIVLSSNELSQSALLSAVDVSWDGEGVVTTATSHYKSRALEWGGGDSEPERTWVRQKIVGEKRTEGFQGGTWHENASPPLSQPVLGHARPPVRSAESGQLN